MALQPIICLIALATLCSAESIPPEATLEALTPKGFRISIPDDGFTLFGFRGNVNKELNGLESDKWNKDVLQKVNGRWVYRDKNIKLNLGDTIYYWIFVMKNGALYKQAPQEWTVEEFVNENSVPVNRPNNLPSNSFGNQPVPRDPVSSCEASRTAVMGRSNICRGELIFSEEFNKNGIKELAFWDPEVKFPQEPDYPFNVYMADGTLRIENGLLIITPGLLESKYHEGFVQEQLDLTKTCTGLAGTRECVQIASGAQILPPVVTGKITTRNKFNFKYGRVEVRAKLPRGSWLIPEINLEPRDNVYGKLRFESGLIRIAFLKGNNAFAKKLYGGPVLYDKEPYRSQFLKEKIGNDWSKDFHNYTLLWKPDGMELFVDGESYGTVYPGDGFYSQLTEKGAPDAKRWVGATRMAPLDEMFYLAFGLRVGGIHDFLDGPDKPWKNVSPKAIINFWNAKDAWFPTWTDADLTVDYVRIYAL